MSCAGAERRANEILTVALVLVEVERIRERLRVELLGGADGKRRRHRGHWTVDFDRECSVCSRGKVEREYVEVAPDAETDTDRGRRERDALGVEQLKRGAGFGAFGHEIRASRRAVEISKLIDAHERVVGGGGRRGDRDQCKKKERSEGYELCANWHGFVFPRE